MEHPKAPNTAAFERHQLAWQRLPPGIHARQLDRLGFAAASQFVQENRLMHFDEIEGMKSRRIGAKSRYP